MFASYDCAYSGYPFGEDWLLRTSLFALNDLQVTSVPEDQILVAVFPGLPTSAELFILPPKNLTERRKGHEGDLEQVSEGNLAGILACITHSKGTKNCFHPKKKQTLFH